MSNICDGHDTIEKKYYKRGVNQWIGVSNIIDILYKRWDGCMYSSAREKNQREGFSRKSFNKDNIVDGGIEKVHRVMHA